MRVWERLRRPEVDAFHERPRRSDWPCGAGRSAEAAVWQQSTLAEEAASQGQATAGFMRGD
eukprot:8216402-Pyramimonas_sp.AAC.1